MEKKHVIISVALATYNEGENIDRCLSSVANIADEIIVVDGGSTDTTVAKAQKHGAVVIQTSNPAIFHINKQKALEACTGTWILQLDADEEVSHDLAREIIKTIALNDTEIDERVIPPKKLKLFKRHEQLLAQRDGAIGTPIGAIVAFFLPRRNYFLGRPLQYAGTYPDGVLRLVKRGYARFPMQSVHEQIEVNGRVGWLTHDLIHYSNPTLKRYLSGADKYTNLLAAELKNPGFFEYAVRKPLHTFFTLLIRHKGILDGIPGILFCFFSALHYPVSYYKYRQLHKKT